ncbi:MAG: hypothetical protein LBS25_03560 [Candidatus Symbiothrix sp.]|jgi:uncharacterized protein involved in exopolysaccharide biosynthesis|nr:hypothetical protein [Candidatus Symbiothrix sp.]
MSTSDNKTEKEKVIQFICLCLAHWYYFIISGIVCAAIGLLYFKTAVPVYTIQSQVALRHDESLGGTVSKGQTGGILSAMGLGKSSENIEDEANIMGSQGNIKQVVKILNLNKVYTQTYFFGLSKTSLYDQSPVLLEIDPSHADTLTSNVLFKIAVNKEGKAKVKVKWGKYRESFQVDAFPATISTTIGDFVLAPSPYFEQFKRPYNLTILYTNYNYMAQIYKETIEIEFYKKSSDMIFLSTNGSNIDRAKNIVNTTINVYNQKWDFDKSYVYDHTVSYVNHRLEETGGALYDADKEVQKFKDQYNLTDIEADVKYYFTVGASIQEAKLTIETQIAGMDILLDFLQDEANHFELIPFNISSENSALSAFVGKYNESMIRLNEIRKSNPQSPLLASMGGQMEANRKNLMVSIKKEKESQENAIAVLKQKENVLDKRIGNVPTIERDYVNLKRNQELYQTIYIFLLEKKEELSIRAAALMPKLKTIDAPYVVNKPVSPDLIKIALMVLFFGGVAIPLGLIYGIPYIKIIKRRK